MKHSLTALLLTLALFCCLLTGCGPTPDVPGGSEGSNGSSSGSTNTAAKTGDTTPVVPAVAALVVSGAALALTLKKRKKEEK